jgi:lantibiotic modifying enzyme
VIAAAAGVPGQWLPRARELAEVLVGAGSSADIVAGGMSWPLQPDKPHLCGLGHGASGPALALEAFAGIDADPRWGLSAAAARRFERAWYSPADGSWADLREGVSYPHMWCHGSVGVSAERLTAVALGSPDAMAAADLAGGLAGARVAASGLVDLPTGPGASHAINGSQCHGLGGMSDLFVDAAVFEGDRGGSWLDLARRCTAQVRRDARRADGWRTGVFPTGDATPGLMLGLSGIGWALMRVADPYQIPSAWRLGTLL